VADAQCTGSQPRSVPCGAGIGESWKASTDAGQCGVTGGVADAEHAERGPVESEHERNRDAEREETASGIRACCAADGMDNSASARCDGTEQGTEGNPRDEARLRVPCETGGACGLADATGGGCGERGDEAQPGRGGHADRAGWARCDILPCRDGKARRVEAGTFPLANGIPGRMGLLRGYGNAIVPEVAEVFVRAWMDCRANKVR
jgi:DNA (cytosine-5)-methyltransferase 1